MTVNVNGIDVNYSDTGKGEPLVLLHGWGSSIDPFRGAVSLVSKKYRAIAPDMPGFGDTPEPPGVWNVDDYADFIIAFLQKLGVEKAIMLGHSFGGRVIIKLAARRELPFIIDKIILVDSAGIKPEKANTQKATEAVNRAGKKILARFPGVVEKIQRMSGSADYRAASPLMRKILVNVVNEDLTQLLGDIKQSTLLIWGSLDTATPLSDGKKMEELIPDSGLAVIEGATHFSFLDNPVLFSKILASFLNIEV